MIKKSSMFIFILLITFSCGKIYAAEGDLLQGFDVTNNGNGMCTVDGWMMSHKFDNSNYTFHACDVSGNNCTELTRNDNESRTDMNTEATEGETFNYDNIGVNQTIPCSYTNLVIRDGNTIVSSGKLVDKDSTDAGIKIAGTQCDLRNESGERSNGDYVHFATGETFGINSVKENVLTDKGDVVTMYCVNVSSKYTVVDGHTFYHPGNDDVACVFDSCGSLVEKAPMSPNEPEPGWKPSVCNEGSGGFNGCSMGNGSISSCGGGTTHSCSDGKYTTGSVFSPSKVPGYELVDASYDDCASATCSYSQDDKFYLTINMPTGNYGYKGNNYFKAGTYFNNPTLSYYVNSTVSNIKLSSCPSWEYRKRATAIYDDIADCDAKGEDKIGVSATTCRDGDRDSVTPSAGQSCSSACRSAGYAGGGGGISVGGTSTCSCYNTYTCYRCEYWAYRSFESDECNSNGQARCEYEINKATASSSVSAEGTATFATDSNSVKNNTKYLLPFNFAGSRLLQNVAYVNKQSGKVYYEPTNISVSRPDAGNTNLYNVYNNVHFIPIDYPTGNYGVGFNANFNVVSRSSRYSVGLAGASCVVPVINLYTPTPNTDGLCEKEPCGYGFIYRPITLSNPFPNSEIDPSGDGSRKIGENWYTWIKDVNNQRKLATAYTKEPDYVVYLNNSMLSQIRTYNKGKKEDGYGYLDLSINVDGSSEFFEENTFICTTVNGNDNNATLCSKNPGYFGLGISEKWGG